MKIIKRTLDEYEEEIEQILTESNITLVDYVVFKKSKKNYFRIVIENYKGVTLSLCENITKKIKNFLDFKNELSDYFLEISSPGVGRILKTNRELMVYKNAPVVVVYKKENKILHENLSLGSLSENSITFTTDNADAKDILLDDIIKIKLQN